MKINNDVIRCHVLIKSFNNVIEKWIVKNIEISKFCLFYLIVIRQLTRWTRDDLSTEFIVTSKIENVVIGDDFHQIDFVFGLFDIRQILLLKTKVFFVFFIEKQLTGIGNGPNSDSKSSSMIPSDVMFVFVAPVKLRGASIAGLILAKRTNEFIETKRNQRCEQTCESKMCFFFCLFIYPDRVSEEEKV